MKPGKFFQELREHKLAAIVCAVVVGLLGALTYLTSDTVSRTDKIEKITRVQRIRLHQLFCQQPGARSCQRQALNIIRACLSTMKCRSLLLLASTNPPTAPVGIPPTSPKGGGQQPHGNQGQQEGGGRPPNPPPTSSQPESGDAKTATQQLPDVPVPSLPAPANVLPDPDSVVGGALNIVCSLPEHLICPR